LFLDELEDGDFVRGKLGEDVLEGGKQGERRGKERKGGWRRGGPREYLKGGGGRGGQSVNLLSDELKDGYFVCGELGEDLLEGVSKRGEGRRRREKGGERRKGGWRREDPEST
jgi:hypothetical protein